jgi:hypothetical protein
MARTKPMTDREIANFITVLDMATDNARDLTRRLQNDSTERIKTLEHGSMCLLAARALLDLHEALLRPLVLAELKATLKAAEPGQQGQAPADKQGLLPRIGPTPIRG